MTKEENEREYKVLSQSISMHALLSDEYARRDKVLTLSLLIVSALLCALTFADDQTLKLFGASPERMKLFLGLLSALVFGLSIIELKVKWAETAEAHADAARRLSALKLKYRQVAATVEADKSKAWSDLSREYASVNATLRPIAEKKFVRLKAHHATKVVVSKMLEQHPGVPYWLVSSKVRLSACSNLLFTKKDAPHVEPMPK